VASTGRGEVITFDRAGRLYSAYLDERFYRRGVNGRVLEKFTAADGRTVRRPLPPALAREIESRALDIARQVDGIGQHSLMANLEADAARFRAAYDGPVPILPPDAYRSVVLQATIGCAYNRCVFCGFYRDRTFRVRADPEFESHIGAVREAFGAGLTMRRGVFLGDADALSLPTDQLVEFLRMAQALPAAAHGIACFGSSFLGHSRPASDWVRIKDAGLRRVHLGVETAHPALRRKLRKPGRAEDALRIVQGLKAAGISVGMIFLTGVGGESYGAAHVRDSAALCSAADLDKEDFVYLSPLVGKDGELTHGPYAEQAEALRAGVGPGPTIAVYDIRHFVY
jgi:radical SAM superfamily enzyme YgiQ (UPF0313 family)